MPTLHSSTLSLSGLFFSMLHQDILEQLPGLFVVMDTRSKFVQSNLSTAQAFGFTDLKDMIGKTALDMRCSAVECGPEFINQDQQVMFSKSELTIFDVHTYANDQTKILLTKKKPFYANGQLVGVICHCTEMHSVQISNVVKYLTLMDKRYYPNNTRIERSYWVGYSDPIFGLTQRELDCLFYIVCGKSTRSIARILHLTSNTVASYIKSIMMKWQCNKRAELIERAIAHNVHLYLPEHVLCSGISQFL